MINKKCIYFARYEWAVAVRGAEINNTCIQYNRVQNDIENFAFWTYFNRVWSARHVMKESIRWSQRYFNKREFKITTLPYLCINLVQVQRTIPGRAQTCEWWESAHAAGRPFYFGSDIKEYFLYLFWKSVFYRYWPGSG